MKINKINWYPLAALVIGLAAFAFSVSAAFAEVISEHDRDDTAQRAAMHYCRSMGGDMAKFDWTQTKRHQLVVEGGVVKTIGAERTYVCEIPQASGPSRWLLTWKAPTTRADCSPLSADDIAGYVIRIGEVELPIISVTEYMTEPMESIDHLTIATVDKNGLESAAVKFGEAHHSPC